MTKTFLPPQEEYEAYLREIWRTGWVTNHGQFVRRLESELRAHLNVEHLRFVNNGTMALQLAIRALGVSGEVITTPFSYVATCSSLVWEGCKPVFADIEPNTLTIDPIEVRAKITPQTQAVLATHVYGNPCDVEALEAIAAETGIRIIYDAAHCFGVRFKDRSLMSYGDASTLSFHATKIFHTIEGGAVIMRNADSDSVVGSMMNFGHDGPENFSMVGINGKASEFNAAMGLCILPRMQEIRSRRKSLCDEYDEQLRHCSLDLKRPEIRPGTEYNYSYYPVLFPSEAALLRTIEALRAGGVNSRRYFYPSLSRLPYVPGQITPVAEDVASRVLCLPLYHDLELKDVARIARLIEESSVG